MDQRKAIEDFVAQPTLAVVGVSSKGQGFGNMAMKELKTKGYHMIPVHPTAQTLEGERCYPNLTSLPEKPGGLLISVTPSQTEKVVREAHAAGITRIWLQQGAQSPDAIQYCEQNGLSVVHGKCIMMYAKPGGMHKFHHWVNGLFGVLYK